MSASVAGAPTVLAPNVNREYLMIIAGPEGATVSFGGGFSITIPDGGHIAPDVVHTGAISINSTNATILVNEGGL